MAPESLSGRPTVVAVVGPTASGKTDLALQLAGRLNGEVISADMGQMYKRLDAGTAKPGGKKRDGLLFCGGVPYHLVDFLEPARAFSAAEYSRAAAPLIEAAALRKKLPLVAGGTGLYVKALLEGLDDLPGTDPVAREKLRERLVREGNEALHEELSSIDPQAARAIPAGNTQRLLRALEVYRATGKPISSFWSGGSGRPALKTLYLGIRRDPQELKRRIDARAERMFPAMIEEVRRLRGEGLSGEEPAFRCIGYREALAVAGGELDADEGLKRMKAATRAYAKRQGTWFRNQLSAVWLDARGDSVGEAADAAVREIRRWNA